MLPGKHLYFISQWGELEANHDIGNEIPTSKES